MTGILYHPSAFRRTRDGSTLRHPVRASDKVAADVRRRNTELRILGKTPPPHVGGYALAGLCHSPWPPRGPACFRPRLQAESSVLRLERKNCSPRSDCADEENLVQPDWRNGSERFWPHPPLHEQWTSPGCSRRAPKSQTNFNEQPDLGNRIRNISVQNA